MIKRILVGLGGTPFTEVAIRRAIELAKFHQATITGVTILDLQRLSKIGPVPLGGSAYAKRFRDNIIEVTQERVMEAMASFEKSCSEASIPFRLEKETGDIFELMISHARYNDVIIFGLRSLFDYGITQEPRDAVVRLISNGVRPVIAVSPHFRTIKKVLIAYSGSMSSAKTMRRFVQLRLWPEMTLHVVHFSEFGGDELLSDAADYCMAHGFTVSTKKIGGSAKELLVSYAKQNDFDMIVLGNSIQNLLIRHLLGDTMLSVIRDTDRPLFLSQ